VWAEDSGVRLLCLAAGIAFLLVPAPVRAQEADDAEPGVEATEGTEGTEGTEDTAPADAPDEPGAPDEPETPEEPEAPKEPEVDPRAEARRKKEEADAAKRKAAEEAREKELERRAKIVEERKKADEEKRKKALAAREAKIKAQEEARAKAIAARDAKIKAKKMARARAVEAAQRKKGVKGRDDIILDDETLAKIRKPEDELKREARIEAAGVSLPPDLRLEYLWSLPMDRPVSKGDIWVHRDIILLLADRSVLYCIRKRDGVPMWAIELGAAPLYPPAVGARTVYAFVQNTFIGIDRARGEVVWRINPGFAPSATPCVSEPNLYIPAWDKRVYAVEVATDKRVFYGGRTEEALTTTEYRFRELWHKTTGGYVLGTPVLLDGFLYFGSEDGYLYAVSQDGEDRYNTQTQGPIRAPVVSRGANVYVGSSDFSAYAFDRLTGKKQWVYPSGSHVLSAIYPDVPAGVAFVGSNKNGIFGICDRPTPERGTEAWHIADAVSIAGVSQDFAYLLLSDRRIAAVEKKKGTVQWVSLLDGVREVVPTMNDWTRSDEQFRLVCLTESGHLACLKEAKEAVRRALKARE
jgi:outer membrane protein assembly factor BamB